MGGECMTRTDNMEWNVYYDEFNQNKIIPFNIFKHYTFNQDVIKLLKSDLTKEQFEKELDRKLLYSFWSKCEYETTIYMASWVGRSEPIKIDIYSQVKLNWNRFVDYCWSFKSEKH